MRKEDALEAKLQREEALYADAAREHADGRRAEQASQHAAQQLRQDLTAQEAKAAAGSWIAEERAAEVRKRDADV